MDTVIQIIFLVLGALILGAALMVVTARNLIHAALWLVSCFLSVGALYLLMEAEFAAIAQVLVYVGAVAVLILFAIMVTPNSPEADQDALFRSRGLALAVAAALFGLLIAPTVSLHAWAADVPGTSATPIAGARELGQALMREYLLPFELASVLLLAALVGAIVIGLDVRARARVLTLAEELRLRRREEPQPAPVAPAERGEEERGADA